MNATIPRWSLVNIGSGNGLVPSGNKPLPEPTLTWFYDLSHSHHRAPISCYLMLYSWDGSFKAILSANTSLCTQSHLRFPSDLIGHLISLMSNKIAMQHDWVCRHQCACWWPSIIKCKAICRHSENQVVIHIYVRLTLAWLTFQTPVTTYYIYIYIWMPT